jgi:hypothetical protein
LCVAYKRFGLELGFGLNPVALFKEDIYHNKLHSCMRVVIYKAQRDIIRQILLHKAELFSRFNKLWIEKFLLANNDIWSN